MGADSYSDFRGNPIIAGKFLRKKVVASSVAETQQISSASIGTGLIANITVSGASQYNLCSSARIAPTSGITYNFVSGEPSTVSIASEFPAIDGTEQSVYVSYGTLPASITLDPIAKLLVYDGTQTVTSLDVTFSGVANAPKLSFSNATGTVHVMAGIAFPKGVVSGNLRASVSSLNVVVRRTWNDGSVKHAVVVGTAEATDVVTFINDSQGGIDLTPSDISAAAPTAVVNLGSLGTASLASLLATPFETWIATPKFIECHYRWNSSVNTAISVEFHVRLWHNGKLWVRACVENSRRIRTSGSSSYNVSLTGSVTIFGTTVYTYSATAIYENTQHIHERWDGGTQYDVVVVHDTKQIQRTKLVPEYGVVDYISESTLSSLLYSYTPNSRLMFTAAMGSGGYQEQIGILPHWDACYLISGDSRAYRTVLAHGKACFSYSILWRESGRMLTPVDYPTSNYSGVNQGGTDNFYSGSLQWEQSHQPSMGYLAYLLTGDALYEDAMLGQLATNFQAVSSTGVGTSRVCYWGQTRGTAWTMRTIANAAALVHEGAYELPSAKAWFDGHIDYYASKTIEEPLAVNSMLGYPTTVSTYNPSAPLTVAPWMHNFWIGVMGYASDVDPVLVTEEAKLTALRDWMYRGIVGFLGDGSTGNFCYTYLADYNIVASSEVVPVFAIRYAKDLYNNWGDVMVATHGVVACGTTVSFGSGEHIADVGMAMPAIAYAQSHGATGMSEAYTRLTTANGWSTFMNNAWYDDPVWSVTPRSSAQGNQVSATIDIANGRPSWRTTMVKGTWKVVPGNKLSDIDPRNNPLINPNYPNSAPWTANTGHPAVVSAWCGACWDDATATFWLPLSGGHQDYYGNEPYKNTLWTESPQWQMLRNPTGAIGNTGGVFNDGLEYTGVNWDGRFRACHSYNKPVYVPGVGPIMTILGATSPNPSGPNYTLLLNEATGESTNLATNSAAGGPDGGSTYDPTRNRIYWLGSSGARLTYFDCVTNVWATISGGTYHNDYSNQSLVYVPTKDAIVNLSAGTGLLSVFSPVTGIR